MPATAPYARSSGGLFPASLAAPSTSNVRELVDRLEEVSEVIRDRLPMNASGLGSALVAAGLATRPLDFEDVADALKEKRLSSPFRVVRRAGATVLVAPHDLVAAETLVTTAAHFILHWGLCTTEALLARLRALTGLSLDDAAVARILTSIPQFRWLDEEAGWFSFAGYGSRVGVALRKIFGVAARVPFSDLRRALSKQVETVAEVPARAMEAYLVEIAGCALVDGAVEPCAPFEPAPLGYNERALVELLRRSGGELATSALRLEAARLGVTVWTAKRLLRTSPLLIEEGGRTRLVGLPRAGRLA